MWLRRLTASIVVLCVTAGCSTTPLDVLSGSVETTVVPEVRTASDGEGTDILLSITIRNTSESRIWYLPCNRTLWQRSGGVWQRVWNTYCLLTGGTPVTVGPGAERTDSLFIRAQPEFEWARSRSGSLKLWMGFFSDLGALNDGAQFSDPFELYSG